MTAWHIKASFDTTAGRVAAGRTGHGPALVLAHGWPWSSFAWHRVIPALAAHFTVHWYDMPGYGGSDMRAGQATGLDVQGRVFAEMLTHWQLDCPHVVAHDFGGAATLRARLLHGAKYDRYVLMNVVALRPWGSAFFDHVKAHLAAFTGLPPHIHAAIVRAYISGALVQPLADDDAERLAAPWLTGAGMASFYAQFAQADERFTAEIEPHFVDAGCGHILWGTDDPWIPIERGAALSQAMPEAAFAPLDGLGHLPQLEDPARVSAALLAALGVT